MVASCGGEHKEVSIASDFQPYVASFYAEARARGKSPEKDDLVVHFSDELHTDENGRCTLSNTLPPTILISIQSWKRMNTMFSGDELEMNRIDLIYHELGHCLLYRVHVMTLLDTPEGKVKASIMYAYQGIRYDFFKSHYSEYIDELFKTGRVIP
jgi:hypothetical protein